SDAMTISDALALSLIPEIKSDKNKFFRDLEADCLSFVSVALAALSPARCYPAGALRTLLDPNAFRDLCLTARQSDLLDGDLAALASSFLQLEIDNPEHYSSALSGAKNALRIFKKSSAFGKLGANHEFDPSELRTSERPVVVFDIARPDILDSFAKVNALAQTARLQSLRRHRNGRPVLLLCDEATTLPVPSVVKDLELMRSFNVTIALFYQSYSSLQRVYGEHNAKSILSSCVNIFMSVNDLGRAKALSDRLGNRTVKTSSQNFAENGSPSSGVGEQARPLLSPDEILSLPPDTMLMTVPGIRPIKLTKAPYYHIEPFKSFVGENPHERHPPSPTTVLRLTYHNDPLSPRAPKVPDLDKRYAYARRLERTRNYTPRAKRFVAREFLWAPIVAVVGVAIFSVGTPHLLLQHTRTDWGQNRCIYVGVGGLRQTADTVTCESVRWIRFGASESVLS
ncbi:MAG: type IV secretory system conjugative DNA transfer family protein, partial [Pseudomonadota bacterium]